MFQMPQYKNQYGDNWGSLSQFGGTSGYLSSPDVPDIGGGFTSQGGPGLLNQVSGSGLGDTASGGWNNWLKSSGLLTSTDAKGIKTDGALGAGIGLLQAGWGAYNGREQLKLGKESLAFQKDLANKNYKAQLGMTRGNIGDQSEARYAANPGATGASSAAEYTQRQLAKYGVA